MRSSAAWIIIPFLLVTAGCCTTCHHPPYGLRSHAVPGAIYGEEMGVVEYHPGPLSWLWRLLGVGRGFPCDDCGPRYWGDWGGDLAGCEACDDYRQWGGTPTLTSRPVLRPSPARAIEANHCATCNSEAPRRDSGS
ncbi:MAG: hypothetical protein ACUVQR_04270 [Thermogutta sp.]